MPTLKALRFAAPGLGGLLSAALTLLYGCFNPNTPPGKFPCTTTADCPDGQVCSAGLRCVLPGSAPDLLGVPDLTGGTDQASRQQDMTGQQHPDQSAGPADMSMTPPRDMAEQRDQSTTAPTDMSVAVNGCSGTGKQLVAGVWACTGNFGPGGKLGTAAGVCDAGQGFVPCTKSHSALLGTIPAGTCQAPGIAGFFASAISIDQVNDGMNNTSTVDCTPGNNLKMPYGLLGCGVDSGAKLVSGANCDGLDVALRCPFPIAAEGWYCSGGPDTAAHNGMTGGVLCCK